MMGLTLFPNGAENSLMECEGAELCSLRGFDLGNPPWGTWESISSLGYLKWRIFNSGISLVCGGV